MYVRENIVKLRNDIKTHFPEKFENEVYFSYGCTGSNFETVNYKSNFSIKYVHSGQERYIVNNKANIISDSKMLIVNDASETSLIHADGHALSIFINPEVINDCLYGLQNKNKHLEDPFNNACHMLSFYDATQDVDKGLKWYFSRLINLNNNLITVDFFYELAESLLLAQSHLQAQINILSNKNLASRRETYRRLEIGKDYIESSLSEPFNLDELSKVSCLSKYYFIRLFNELYGFTPHRYYLIKKLEKVMKILQNNSQNIDSLNEIASDYSFSNYSVFYKQFKKIYGCSPSDINKQ